MSSIEAKKQNLSSLFEAKFRKLKSNSSSLEIKRAVFESLYQINDTKSLDQFKNFLLIKGRNLDFTLAEILKHIHLICNDITHSTFFKAFADTFPDRLYEFYEEVYKENRYEVVQLTDLYIKKVFQKIDEGDTSKSIADLIQENITHLITRILIEYNFDIKNNLEIEYILKKISIESIDYASQIVTERLDDVECLKRFGDLTIYFDSAFNSKTLLINFDSKKIRFVFSLFSRLKENNSRHVVFTPEGVSEWEEVSKSTLETIQNITKKYVDKNNYHRNLNIFWAVLTVACFGTSAALVTNFNGFQGKLKKMINPEIPLENVLKHYA